MKKVYCYFIIFLSVSFLFPVTPQIFIRLLSILAPPTPLAAEVGKRDILATLPGLAGAENIVTIDPEMAYIGDDGGVGLVYEKEFTLRSVGSRNILSLRVAGMVAVRNHNASEDYSNGFYTNKLYINGHYIDNLNNYCFHEEDRTFRNIVVPLASDILHPGRNKLIVMAKGPKGGNHDDFAVSEIKLYQW
jgi:hypothetical protein